MTTVNVDVLRDVTNRIFDFIERDLGLKSVDLRNNFYWSISDDALYAMDNKPQELDVGSLVDDYDFVSAAHGDPSQAIPLVLMHVAPLLKWLSRAVPSYAPPSEKKT